MPMSQVILRVPEEVRSWLETESKRTGMPQAEIVRRILLANMRRSTGTAV